MNQQEKTYRLMTTTGVIGVAVGTTVGAVGLAAGVMMIVSGARLLMGKRDLLI